MNRVVVVVFDKESKAYEGKEALWQLDNEGSVAVYACAVVAKNSDGTASVKQENGSGPVGTLVGTSLASFLGLVGGPIGLAVGAAAGVTAGVAYDLHNARIGDDFIDDVRKALTPWKVAVVAEVEEDWTAPLDTRMERLGGTVYRRAMSAVRDTANDEDTAAIKADIAQLKLEQAQAHAERKAKLQDRLNQLDSKLQARLQQAKERRQVAESAVEAKVAFLRTKAAAAKAKTS
jgi:uncharacterized membrane protein